MTSPLRSTAPVAPSRAPRTNLRPAGQEAPRRAPRQAPRPTPARRSAPRHLRVVEPPVRRGRQIAVGILVVVVVFGALLGAAVAQSMLVTGQDRIDQTNDRIVVAERSLQKERAQLAAAESPEQLALAAARIGMVAPAGRDWIPADSVGPAATDPAVADPSTTSELAAPTGDGAEATAETR